MDIYLASQRNGVGHRYRLALDLCVMTRISIEASIVLYNMRSLHTRFMK